MRIGVATFLIATAAALSDPPVHAGEESLVLADGPGREVTSANCALCHSLDYLPMNAPVMNRAGWEKTLHKMVDKFGAPVAEADFHRILDYLSEHYSELP